MAYIISSPFFYKLPSLLLSSFRHPPLENHQKLLKLTNFVGYLNCCFVSLLSPCCYLFKLIFFIFYWVAEYFIAKFEHRAYPQNPIFCFPTKNSTSYRIHQPPSQPIFPQLPKFPHKLAFHSKAHLV